MGVQISFATPADDADIRGLLRREPIPGRIAISYEREPDFSIGCDATGENAAVLVARDMDTGDTVGVACRSEREVYVNSAPVRLGYLGQVGAAGNVGGDLSARAEAQVRGARVSFVQGVGMYFGAAGSLIFASEKP